MERTNDIYVALIPHIYLLLRRFNNLLLVSQFSWVAWAQNSVTIASR